MADRETPEERSLDLVQRVIVSSLLVAVYGTVAVALAVYLVARPEEFSRSSRVALWVWSGAVGLVVAALVLVINRRRPYAPWVLLGLVPMAVSAWWIF